MREGSDRPIMTKTDLACAGLVLTVLLACKLPGKKEEGQPAASAAAVPSAAPPSPIGPAQAAAASAVAAAAAAASAAQAAESAKPLTQYSTEGLTQIPDNCVDPRVVLTAVPKTHFDSEGFLWRFARQVALANPEFEYLFQKAPGQRKVFFKAAEHKPTKGVALLAECNDAKTCMQFAAAYKTVVPTSRPEPICGKAPTIGEDVTGPMVLIFGDPLESSLPAKEDAVSKCVRLAACQAARDKKLEGDPAIDCQKKPSSFKLECAMKFPCSKVLACSE